MMTTRCADRLRPHARLRDTTITWTSPRVNRCSTSRRSSSVSPSCKYATPLLTVSRSVYSINQLQFTCTSHNLSQKWGSTMTATNQDDHKQWPWWPQTVTMTATNQDDHKQWPWCPQTVTMMATNSDHDGHKPRWPQTVTMMATNSDHDAHKQWPWRPQTKMTIDITW